MKKFILKISFFTACFLGFFFSILPFTSCNTEGVKLSRDDRYRIDTLTSRQTNELSSALDKICRDSTPMFRQHFVDSLLIVREQEILKQTPIIPQ